jgi:hypothetical protein
MSPKGSSNLSGLLLNAKPGFKFEEANKYKVKKDKYQIT